MTLLTSDACFLKSWRSKFQALIPRIYSCSLSPFMPLNNSASASYKDKHKEMLHSFNHNLNSYQLYLDLFKTFSKWRKTMQNFTGQIICGPCMFEERVLQKFCCGWTLLWIFNQTGCDQLSKRLRTTETVPFSQWKKNGIYFFMLQIN